MANRYSCGVDALMVNTNWFHLAMKRLEMELGPQEPAMIREIWCLRAAIAATREPKCSIMTPPRGFQTLAKRMELNMV